MAEPFIGEIRMFPYSFAPLNWAYCNGQLIQISQNMSLYAIIGTRYGGNGTTNFGVPNLQGRVPMHAGTGPGLTPRPLAYYDGYPTVQLTEQNLPSHTHTVHALYSSASTSTPSASVYPAKPTVVVYSTDLSDLQPMSDVSISTTGSYQYHENRQPYLVVPFFISLMGIFPPRN